MASQYDEEHFTPVSFPIYSIKSCCESHSFFDTYFMQIYSAFLCINEDVAFFGVNIIFY